LRPPSARPVHHGVGEALELLAARFAAEVRASLGGVAEGGAARPLERVGRGDARERTVEWAACERLTDGLVGLRRVEERHRRRALAEVGAGDLAGVLGLPGAVEDVVRDLERDPERQAVATERRHPTRAEQARGLEQLPGLERAARQIVV